VSAVDAFTVGGTASGAFTPSYNNLPAAIPLVVTDEQQTITLTGATNSTAQILFGGVSGSVSGNTSLTLNSSLSAASIQAYLRTIPALSATQGNVLVTPAAQTGTAQPYTVTFRGTLSGIDVPQLTVNPSSGATFQEIVKGSAPTTAQFTASLNTIPALNGNVTVTQSGNASPGPIVYSISFRNGLSQQAVAQVVTTPTNPVYTGNTTVGSATVSGLIQTLGLAVGMTVTGAGIPAGTTIRSITAATATTPGSVTLSSNATATASSVVLTFTGGVTATNAAQVGITANAGGTLQFTFDGTPATGPALEVASVETLTVAAPPTRTGNVISGNTTVAGLFANNRNGTLTAGSTTISGLSVNTGTAPALVVGMAVAGPGIPAGAKIVTITPNTTITIDKPATLSGTQALTFGSNSNNLAVGMLVSGTGIVPGTTIASIPSGNASIVLSQAPTATVPGDDLTFTGGIVYLSFDGGATLSAAVPVTPGATANNKTAIENALNGITVPNAQGVNTVLSNAVPGGNFYVDGNGDTFNVTFYGSLSGAPEIVSTFLGTIRTGTTATSGSPNITGLSQTSDLTVGMPVFGANIPAGATITQINNSTSITISANPTSAGLQTLTFSPTSSSTTAGGVVSATTAGGNLPPATAPQARTGNITADPSHLTNINIITNLSSTSDLTVGNTVTGTGIPAGTRIAAIINSSTIAISNNATAANGVSVSFGDNSVQSSLLTIPALTPLGSNLQVSLTGSTYNITVPSSDAQFDALTTGELSTAASVASNVIGVPGSPTAAQVEAAMATIPGLAGNVKAFGPGGGPFEIVFTNGNAGELAPLMTTSALGGLTATVTNDQFATIANNTVQRLSFNTTNGNAVITPGTSTFVLTMPIGSGSIFTDPIAYSNDPDTLASTMQVALNKLFAQGEQNSGGAASISTTGGPGGSTLGNIVVTPITQTEYNINFQGLLANANMPALTITISNSGPSRAGTTATGSNTITNLSTTSDLAVGLIVAGTGIPAGSTITAITSPTTITISANATANGSPTLTFTSNVAANGTTGATSTLNRIYQGAGNTVQVMDFSGSSNNAPFDLIFDGIATNTVTTWRTDSNNGFTADGLANFITATGISALGGNITVVGPRSSSPAVDGPYFIIFNNQLAGTAVPLIGSSNNNNNSVFVGPSVNSITRALALIAAPPLWPARTAP